MSRSLFAGRALGAGCAAIWEGSARGIVLTSRSVPRRICERMLVLLGGGELVLWSSVEESQDCWTADWEGAGVAAAAAAAGVGMGVLWGFGGVVPFWARAWASHASRVLWSTGQAAAGSSCEDIVVEMCEVGFVGFRETRDGDGSHREMLGTGLCGNQVRLIGWPSTTALHRFGQR